MKRLVIFAVAIAIAFVLACRREAAPAAPAASPAHEREILQWRAGRLARLTSETGWLSLVGLQWLSEGENKIENPPNGGVVVLKNGAVTLQPNHALSIDGKPVTAPTPLLDDTAPNGPTVVSSGTVRFNVHTAAGRYGLRVKDSQAETRTHFKGLDSFPISDKWRVEARFEPFHPPRHIAMPNVMGVTTDEVAPGLLTFTVDGKEYTIEPIYEEGTKDFFIVFKDATSGKETYPAARFVYAPPPDASGRTVIDFNKAYNPPCAFTTFATCPLPPPQNRLPIRVEAGEKKYAGSHHGSNG